MKQISVTELKKRMDAGEDLLIIDVREPYECNVSRICDNNIPINHIQTIEEKYQNEKDKEIILYCRSGNRSGVATSLLSSKGFKNATNMVGGMLEWKNVIDPSIEVG